MLKEYQVTALNADATGLMEYTIEAADIHGASEKSKTLKLAEGFRITEISELE